MRDKFTYPFDISSYYIWSRKRSTTKILAFFNFYVESWQNLAHYKLLLAATFFVFYAFVLYVLSKI